MLEEQLVLFQLEELHLEPQLLDLSQDLSHDLEAKLQTCHHHNLSLQPGVQHQLDLCLPLYHLEELLNLVQELNGRPAL